jgi:type I restriction enzyme, S subunit
VLKKAFEGELTRKWRKANENEDIEYLFFEINKERVEYFNNKGKKIKKVKPIGENEISMLAPLPENWKRVRLNDLSFLITDGKHGDCRNHENSGYFFISAKDIFDGKINYANARQIQKEDFEEVHKRTDLQPEDVLITNAGTIGRIAITTVNAKTSKTTFQKSVAIIKKPNSLIDSKYLAYHLENDVERIKLVSKGTAQSNLLLGTMSELIIAVCPVKEQQIIVQEIETRLSICDKIEQDIKENLEKAEALRQSILKKAFEGKLLNEKELAEVRKAEDWEPAEVLLGRIKAERDGNGKSRKHIPEQSKKTIRDEKGLTQQATLQVFEQVDN